MRAHLSIYWGKLFNAFHQFHDSCEFETLGESSGTAAVVTGTFHVQFLVENLMRSFNGQAPGCLSDSWNYKFE